MISNNFNVIEKSAFSSLSNLRELQVSTNAIAEIQELLFNDNSQLEFLRFNGNQTSSVHSRAFQLLPRLHDLHLDNNRIEIIVSFDSNIVACQMPRLQIFGSHLLR